jgi:hypothetical protein
MTTLRKAAAAAALFGSMLLPPAAALAQIPAPGIPGFPNHLGSSFAMTKQLVPALVPLPRTGTVTVVVNASITANIPVAQPISCSVTISAVDNSFVNVAASSALLKRSGGTGTCTVVVPYIFDVVSDQTLLNVSVDLIAGTSTVAYFAERGFAPFPVPNGNVKLTTALAV